MVASHQSVLNLPQLLSLEEWLLNPVDGTEWVDGQLIEKVGMTLKHSRVQRQLSSRWAIYKDANGLGGEVYTEVPCRTNKQGRSPDVAYLTPALMEQYGEPDVLPQSFPLSAEIVSPTDFAEQILLKAQEYLQSGGEEVWLVFPESQLIMVVTQDQSLVFRMGQVVRTQVILKGFSLLVDDLLG
jgi:Uma2 family endonuclease